MYLALARNASISGRRIQELLSKLPAPTEIAGDHLAARRISDAEETEYFDLLQDVIASVVFSYMAIEAFANSLIPAEFVYRRVRPDKHCTEEYNREQIERYLSLREKLHEIVPLISKRPSIKGTNLWDQFGHLERLRDRLVHLKREDWRERTPEDAANSVWSALVAPGVVTMYKIAVDVLWHFTESNRPRWVTKLKAMSDSDAA
jgi:hypothetical protein